MGFVHVSASMLLEKDVRIDVPKAIEIAAENKDSASVTIGSGFEDAESLRSNNMSADIALLAISKVEPDNSAIKRYIEEKYGVDDVPDLHTVWEVK